MKAMTLFFKPLITFLKNYFQLLTSSFLSPIQFSEQNALNHSFQNALQVLLFTIFLMLGTQTLIQYSLAGSFHLLIPAFFDLLILIPIGAFLFVLLACFFFLIAKVLNGKGSLKQTLIGFSYASVPLTLSGIPIMGEIAFLFSLGLLILFFKKIHHYSLLQSLVTILLPTVAMFVILLKMGILHFQLLNQVLV